MRLLIILFALMVPAAAQLDRGSIVGTVTDGTGAVIPGAKVAARHLGTGVKSETTCNETGQYSLPNLQAAAYEVQIEAQGFKRLIRGGVSLSSTQVLRVDAVMEVGGTTEAITVTAEVPKLQTDTPEVASTLGGQDLLNLPLSFNGSGRQAENLAYKIMPGLAGNTWQGSANGSAYFSKESLLDGASVTTYLAGHMGESHVPNEALQEFKVMTSGMSAEFGRAQGGVFNYVMRSGSNEVHGSLFASIRNEALNANTFANKFRGAPRALDRKGSYVGSLGGPVYIPKVYDGRNKTFVFGTFEHSRQRENGLGNPSNSIPVPEFYEGDFSRILGSALAQSDALGRPVYQGAVYDPATFRQVSGGRWVGDMFPGNRIPVSRFSTVSKNLNAIGSKYVPAIKDADGRYSLQRNAYGPLSSKPLEDTYAYTIKADHNIGVMHKLSGSYAYNVHPRLRGAGGLWDPSLEYGGPLSTTVRTRTKAQMGRLAYDWTVSPTVLNHFVASINRMGNPSKNVHADVDGAAALGIKGLSSPGYPIVDWGTGPIYTLINPGEPQFSYSAYNSWGYLDTVSFSKGRHFMKAGVDIRGNQLNNRPGPAPSFAFRARGTAIPNESFSGTTTGYAFASYLLGIVDAASLADPAGMGGRRYYYALFFQDDFKVNSRLSLNLGLRWEYQPPVTEVADRYGSWSTSVKDPESGRMGAYEFAGTCSYCTGRDYFGVKSYRDFGPRIGLAYRLSDKWTIRAAYGIMFEGDLFNGYSPTPLGKQTSPQYGGTYQLASDPVTPWVGIFNWDQGFPQNRYVPAEVNPSWGNKNGPGMVDPSYGRSPYIQMWNFNLQRQLPFRMILDAGYVANTGVGLRNSEIARINQIPASALTRYGKNLTNPVRNEAEAAANGVAYPFPGYRGTVAGAVRDYPQLNGISTVKTYAAPLGFSTYHSLQVGLNKDFSHGISMYANYVWSKSLTNTENSFVGNNTGPMDYYNLALEKAVSADDVPHNFKGFVNYQLPFGKGKPILGGSGRLVDSLVGGWEISAVLNYNTGLPLGFVGSNPTPNAWNGGNRANMAPGEYILGSFDKSKFEYSTASSPNNTYLNKSLFSDPPALTLGNSAPRYTQIRTFAAVNEDITFIKRIALTEKCKLQLRADFLNVFNRHQLGGPNTSVLSPLFGQITSVNGNRNVQVGARLDF